MLSARTAKNPFVKTLYSNQNEFEIFFPIYINMFWRTHYSVLEKLKFESPLNVLGHPFFYIPGTSHKAFGWGMNAVLLIPSLIFRIYRFFIVVNYRHGPDVFFHAISSVRYKFQNTFYILHDQINQRCYVKKTKYCSVWSNDLWNRVEMRNNMKHVLNGGCI